MDARRPRVLVVITLAQVGGAQSYVMSLLPALAERYEVAVAVHGPGPVADAAREAGIRLFPLEHVRRPIRPWRDARGLLELIRLFRRFRPDVVHLNSSKAGMLGRLAAVIVRVPARIYTAHGWGFSGQSGLARLSALWTERALAPLTTMTICVSESDLRAGLAAGVCRRRRSVVIPNGIDVGAAALAHANGTVPSIVSVGRLRAPKDFVTFVRALELLEPGSYRARIVGDGPDRALLPANGVVELTGERDDVGALLASSHVFVLSSRWEGLPISVLEAKAAGLPVVASAVGGVPEVVLDGETGLLVPPGEPDALASALRLLIADPELRARMGAAGRARAEELFDLPRFRQAHFEVYDALLAG